MNCTEDDQILPVASATIEIEADTTVGYAAIHNSVPVVKSLRFKNTGNTSLENISVVVNCSPPFCRAVNIRFEKLAPGESHKVFPIDLSPDHEFLSNLSEATSATLNVSLTVAGLELSNSSHFFTILAYDEWAGTRSLPELLAAFCMPNNPSVDQLLGKASKLLRAQFPDLSMDGYQSKNREIVWKQISAIYSAAAAENLQYSVPPASFGIDGQKVRTPDRILESRIATCLDLALLFASCFEQAGLHPVILFKEGHAWIGVWLHAASFSSALLDDAQSVKKRIDGGEFIVFETTGVALHHALRPSLRIAMEAGYSHISNFEEFRFAIDIHKARMAKIRPLPSKATPGNNRPELSDESVPQSIEPVPYLPPIDPSFFMASTVSIDASTPEGRLAKWKSRLLDLTLRNRLLNFKASKTTLQLIAPDVGLLEDALSDGSDFRIQAMPIVMEGSDPRVAKVHLSRTGSLPLDEMAIDALKGKELFAKVAKADLDSQLLALHSAARTSLEEGGANTLFLAIGFLRWTETDSAESSQIAPILLLPVTLERHSVQSGFRVKRHEDEALLNPTLLEFLKIKFELKINGLDEIPLDESGLDVEKILQAFRLAVRDLKGWQIEELAVLGIFSFTKYLMWKDLQDRASQLKSNRVVEHLIEHPGEAFAKQDYTEQFERLDASHRPQDLLTPLLADSSQLKAICAIDAGLDLVLEGPPGTGKSQTIANLIAHNLAKGKTVLFVSEKMAALEVVHNRLNAIGLGPFCLQLHSSKAKKSEVLGQLGQALDIQGIRTAEQWEQEAERLGRLRADLNDLAAALHFRHDNGLTVHEAIGTCIANAGIEPSRFTWQDPHVHNLRELDCIREVAKKITTLAKPVGSLVANPLRTIGQLEWSPSWQDDLLDACSEVQLTLEVFQKKAGAIEPIVGRCTQGLSLEGYAALDHLVDALGLTSSIPIGLARKSRDETARMKVHALAKHGIARAGHWQTLSSSWKPQIAKQDAEKLREDWSLAVAAWWPKSAFSKNALKSRLALLRCDLKKPSDDEIERLFEPLTFLNAEDSFLNSMQFDAEQLLGEFFEGVKTDWHSVLSYEKQAQDFSEAVNSSAGGEVSTSSSMWERLENLVAEGRSQLDSTKSCGKALADYRNAWRNALSAISKLEKISKPLESLQGPSDSQGALERILSLVATWKSSQNSIQAWCHWRQIRQKALDLGLDSFIPRFEIGEIELARAESHFEFSYRNWWTKKIIDRDPVLRSFSSADHDRKIFEFRAADQAFQRLTEQYIVAKLSGKIPSASAVDSGAESEMSKLRRELQKQRKHLPVRQLVKGLPTLLPRLKPCLLMSPLSVAQYLDASFELFDLVVFDEASQIAVWDAVGAIARGKQLVVVGDPKQLPPTNFFSRSRDSETANVEDVEDLESILDECLGAGMNKLSLQWHYRSKHESLITFSNVNYYESKLVTFPSPVTSDQSVTFRKVNGIYDRGASKTNRSEADAIIDAIEEHFLSNKKRHLSLGVVTFNQPQQALIECLLDARRRMNDKLDRSLMERVKEPLFVKNLENVQGDERDVILFSITYGPDAAGKTLMNFGPLNGEGGHRRLNVAISRARERVEIFSTLLPQNIDLSRVRAAGVRDLKNYLDFAIKGPRALIEQNSPTGLEPDSPFEIAVMRALREKGWTVHPQIGCSGYRIDIGVVDPSAPGRYLVGIECDGRSYHSGATARDRDRLRQHVLEGLGWKILRIWSTDWWTNYKASITNIEIILNEIVKSNYEAAEAVAQEDNDDANLGQEAGDKASEGSPNSENTRFELDESNAPEKEINIQSLRAVTESAVDAHLVYRIAELSTFESSKFYEVNSNQFLLTQIRTIIDVEGPISESILFRKIARAWGLERTGARIVERLKQLAGQVSQCTVEGKDTFYWPQSLDLSSWKDFRTANENDASRRNIHDVAIQEIFALIYHVLENSGSPTKTDVARNVCRLIGMARTPADAEARVVSAIDLLCAQGKIDERDAYVRKTA